MKNSKLPVSSTAIEDLCEQIIDLAGEARLLARIEQEPLMWRNPANETPATDEELVVVKTASGAKYFGSTINGKFMNNVVAWCPLPKD